MSFLGLVTEPANIVIIGASGDLTQRKLIPALHSLGCEELLSPHVRVIGLARSALAEDSLREHLFGGVVVYARHKPAPGLCELWPQFARRITYLAGDYADPQTYRRLAQRLAQNDAEAGTQGNRLFYLAIPPTLYGTVIQHLGQAGLQRSPTGWTRIIIEKPFGRDLESARQLNAQVHAVFDEEQVYRIDHYLGKETVQNILVLRFANSIFEPLWNRNYVDHVQITMAEDIGIEHRASYYEQAGVVRDMVQNHMLQLLTLTAMEPPAALSARTLRDEKVKVLQAVRPVALSDGVWGQYEGYRSEPGVSPDSRTSTFVALKLYVDNWRWQGVPFYVRTGKRMAEKTTRITLQFKQVPHLLFPESMDLLPNSLSLFIQPDEGVNLCFETKVPGAGMRTKQVDMAFAYKEHFGEHLIPDAYERLLLDALQGDASLFARSDEIELAWRLVDPLTAEREPLIYAVGSWGPPESDALLARDGRAWH